MHNQAPSTPIAPGDMIRNTVQHALDRYQGQPGNLLPILHAVQDALGYIPPSCILQLSQALRLSRAEIHGVISFYAHFRQTPAAPVKLEICRAEACQSMGGTALAAHATSVLGCHFKETSQDNMIDLEPVYCLGLCAQSPAITLNGRPYAHMSPDKLDLLLASHRASNTQTNKEVA